MSERIAFVDENNRFIEWVTRKEIHDKRLVHRSIHVALFTKDQRLWLQLRHRDKATFAHHWDISCSGHVDESDYFKEGPDARLDEVHERVANRELQEELGVQTTLSFIGTYKPIANVHYEHIYFYIGNHDGPFLLQFDEVEEVKAVSYDELFAMREHAKITPTLLHFAQLLKEEKYLK
jgi:isopentenyldiphosphate isomerase